MITKTYSIKIKNEKKAQALVNEINATIQSLQKIKKLTRKLMVTKISES